MKVLLLSNPEQDFSSLYISHLWITQIQSHNFQLLLPDFSLVYVKRLAYVADELFPNPDKQDYYQKRTNLANTLYSFPFT